MDMRGSITKWLQSDGSTVFATREYDAFGQIIPNSTVGAWPGRFSYQGQAWMEFISANASQRLLLSPTRIYDPSIGRFLQNEPMLRNRPSAHYIYSSNNPVNVVDPTGLWAWRHFIGAMGEAEAERMLTSLGWKLVTKVANTTTAGFDLVFLEETANGPLIRIVDNKAYSTAATLGEKALSAVTTNFETNLADTAAKVAASNLDAAVKKQFAAALEAEAYNVVITNFYGNSIKISGSLAADVASRITVMTEAEVADLVAARLAAEAIEASVAGTVAKWGGKALGFVFGAVASVGATLLMMDSPAQAADYTPQQRMIDAINTMIYKGYTDRPRDTYIKSIEEAGKVEIESWRLSNAEFKDAINIINSLPYPKNVKDDFIAELKEERDRLTDSCDDE